MTLLGSIAWFVVGAALLATKDRVSIAPVPWIALTLMLHASRSMTPGRGAAIVWLALFVSTAISRRGIVPIPGVAYYVVIVAISLVLTVPFFVDRLVVGRIGLVGTALVFPAAWVAVEFLQARLTPNATWSSLAGTQFGNLPLMQLAAYVGVFGISFLIAWFASTAELAWSRGFDWNVVRGPVLLFAAVSFVVFSGGATRVAIAPTDRPAMRVAMLGRPSGIFVPGEMTRIAEGRVSSAERPGFDDKLSRLHDWYLDGSRREARAGARLIAWPEQNLLVFSEDEAAFIERAQRLAAEERAYLAMGLGTVYLGDPKPLENKLVLIDPAGRVAMSYRKTHPVPGWEASIMKAGDGRLPVVATDDGRIAGAICYDADFPEFIRQAALGSADLLIVPANEWKAIKHLHYQMAAFRAIETGATLVRPAAVGISSAIDAWGRVLGSVDEASARDHALVVQVPVRGVQTLYSRIGDLFAWLCVTAAVVALAIVAVNRPH
jgi:apolipoprotein N-acyltransferase